MSYFDEWMNLKERSHNEGFHSFFDFICSWVPLNNLLSEKYGIRLNDSQKIQRLGQCHTFKNNHREFLGDESYASALDVLKLKSPIRNMKNGNSISLVDAEDFSQVIDTIYTIRNNLFHGSKSPDIERDKILCSASAKVIEALLRKYFEENSLEEEG